MSHVAVFITIASALLCTAVHAADSTTQPDPLSSLRPGHPRLFMHADDWQRLKSTIQNDPTAAQWYAKLQDDAKKILTQKPVVHELIGPRLLSQSRRALDRISTLAAIYRLSGDARFLDRARQEMLAAAAFPDWNPSHFLDVAEMTNALAIGYDWLYDDLTPEDRKTIRTGIVELGLKPGLQGFEKGAWWTTATHNWGQVCEGGLTVGLLAVADEEPELARKLFACTSKAVVAPMSAFAPDGGCPEGPGYWGYATRYHVFYLAAIESALGTDMGLKQIPGVAQTGFFRIHSVGPLGKTFNFADCGGDANAGREWQMFYLAKAFNQPVFAAQERQRAATRPDIFDLLNFSTAGSEEDIRQLPLDAIFRGVNVAFFRSAWNDPNALYVGFKGGDNQANHSHLDLGTFVLDAAGQRWAVDLGSDNYNLPNYFGKDRWTYYRLRTEGHNTLTLDDQNQATDGKAPLIAYQSKADRAFAVADLSSGYRAKATEVLRGMAMLDRQRVLVQDEVEASQPVQVTWNFHTAAKIDLRGEVATLMLGQATLQARILSPAGVAFEVIEANPAKPQGQQPEVKNLIIRLPEKASQARIVVLFSPGDSAKLPVPAIEPLGQWIAAGPLGQ